MLHGAALVVLMTASPVISGEVDAVSSSTASDEAAHLEADWNLAGGSDAVARRFELAYRFRNHGKATLALIDRGSRDAPGRLSPHQAPAADGLTLSIEALPLSDPAPTYPEAPLARLVAPGQTVEGVIRLRVPATLPAAYDDSAQQRVPIQRVRFCLGYAPFSEDGFVAQGNDWIPNEITIRQHQRQLCTSWHELDPASG